MAAEHTGRDEYEQCYRDVKQSVTPEATQYHNESKNSVPSVLVISDERGSDMLLGRTGMRVRVALVMYVVGAARTMRAIGKNMIIRVYDHMCRCERHMSGRREAHARSTSGRSEKKVFEVRGPYDRMDSDIELSATFGVGLRSV